MSRLHHQVSGSTGMMMITVLLFGLVSNILISESQVYQPDYDCNPVALCPDDPYWAVVDQLLNDIVSFTPGQPDLNFFTSNTDNNGVTAYGYGECDPDFMQPYEGCSECLAMLQGALDGLCSTAVGAQVAMGGCYMRYEDYKFM